MFSTSNEQCGDAYEQRMRRPVSSSSSFLADVGPRSIVSSANCTVHTTRRCRVMTFNIDHAELGIQRIADKIRLADADVVGLQEVDVNTQRTKMDQPQVLCDLLNTPPSHRSRTTAQRTVAAMVNNTGRIDNRRLVWEKHYSASDSDGRPVDAHLEQQEGSSADKAAPHAYAWAGRSRSSAEGHYPLARQLQHAWQAAFGKAIPFQGGAYGDCALTRLPVLQRAQINLGGGAIPGEEDRETVALRLQVCTCGDPAHGLWFVTTHLGLSTPARDAQFPQLVQFIESLPYISESALVLTGDFNLNRNQRDPEYQRDVLILLQQRLGLMYAGPDQPTWPANKPVIQIDYVFGRAGKLVDLQLSSTEIVPAADASDHNAICTEFIYSVAHRSPSSRGEGVNLGFARPRDHADIDWGEEVRFQSASARVLEPTSGLRSRAWHADWTAPEPVAQPLEGFRLRPRLDAGTARSQAMALSQPLCDPTTGGLFLSAVPLGFSPQQSVPRQWSFLSGRAGVGDVYSLHDRPDQLQQQSWVANARLGSEAGTAVDTGAAAPYDARYAGEDNQRSKL